MKPITEEQIRNIRNIAHFRDSQYGDLDINGTLDYMKRRFVDPIAQRLDIQRSTLADCAAGFGWLSFAYLLDGGLRAFVMEPDPKRLAAAMSIAAILEVEDRCVFVNCLLQEADLEPDSVDVFASIETLEHVGKHNVSASVCAITRIAKSVVLLTTPNRLFPVIAHDTQLPFAHWLPAWPRKVYAQALNRQHRNVGNYFLAPWDLNCLHEKFRPDAKCQTFSKVSQFRAFYPYYLPYGSGKGSRNRARPSTLLTTYMHIAAALAGNHAYAIAPNLASVWVRRVED